MEELIEAPEAFRVEDDELASWAMRKFAERVKQMKANERLARKELDRVAAWLERENSKLAQQAEFFEEHLKDYGRRERDRRKTISLPYGKIKGRQLPDRVELPENFVEWAQQNNRDDLLIFATPKPALSVIKAQAKEIPGVEIVEGSVSFSVEVSDED